MSAMRRELRKTGIDIVGDMPWGTHFCHFYETEEDLLDILIPYFRTGLANNEFCIWIVFDPINEEQARNVLKSKIPEAERHLAAGDIEIIPHTQWYLRNFTFDLQHVINSLEEKLARSIYRGYAGMRLNGNTAWLKEGDRKDFAAYEEKVNELILNQRMIVLCSYPLATTGASEIFDMAHAHQSVIAKRHGNWEALETPDLKQAKAEIRRLNEELEQRVFKRTEELAEVNKNLRREISEREFAEKALQKSEERFRSYFNLGLIGIAITSPKKGWIEVNDQMCKILGYDRNELMKLTWAELTHPEDLSTDSHYFNRVLSGQIDGYEIDKRFIRKDGQVIYAAISVKCLRKTDGSVDYLVGLLQDITERKEMESTLRNKQELLQKIFETIPVMITIYNPPLKDFTVNKEFERVTGYTNDELKSIDLMEACFPDAEYRNMAASFMGSLKSDWRDFVIRTKSGKNIETAWTNIYLSDKTHVGVGIDISERKLAEAALRESERKYRELVENANSIILRWNPSGEITFINEFGQKFFGYRENEILGLNVMGTIVPDVESTGRNLSVLMAGILDTPAAFERNVNENVLRDGHRVWIAWTNKTVFDANGNLVEVLSIGTDITERKQVEEALRVAEKTFRDLLENVQLVAILLDRDGNINFCNDYFLNLTEWKKEEVLRQNWFDLFIPDRNRQEVKAAFSSFIAGEKNHSHYEDYIWTRRGAERFISWNDTVLHDQEGKIIGTASIGIDITEHKKLEAQLRAAQKMEAVGQLAGGIAHDFNNILSAIVGYAYLLQSRLGRDDPSRDDVEQILDSAGRAAEVTHSLLAFSKKQITNPKPVLINDIVKGFVELLSRVIGESITISTSLSCNEMRCVADTGQIEQVLMNLATNARDAMPHGGRLTLGTECVEIEEAFIQYYGYGKLGLYALISVSDTGEGMSKETAEKVFEPFFTTKETGKGTGLGLAVVYGIVKQHNGYINVYSEPGEGTTFNIYLPAVESKEEVNIKVMDSLPSNATETILVAEDNEKLRKLSETILSQQGYKVILAPDGQEAIEKYIENKERIHLILLDMIMPKKSGKEVYDEILIIKPDMKVIFVSGYTADRIDKESLRGDNVDFIFKPVQPKHLLRKIREMLDK